MSLNFDIPGFVDLQINGYVGVDFSSKELSFEKLLEACDAIISSGTAFFLPTIITSPEKLYRKNLKIFSKLLNETEFSKNIPGIHIEGPFISPEPGAIGAHPANCAKNPNIDFLKKLIDWSDNNIKLLTIAAELEGAEELANFAENHGITVSLGHQMAGLNDLKRLEKAGAHSITHFGNGMPNFVHRHKNQILAGLICENLSAMLIADGQHIPPELIKLIIKTKGVDKTIITSDASPIAGLPPGKYNTLGNDVVLEKNGLLHNPEKECLVGSSASMRDCMNYLASLDFLPLEKLCRVGIDNPLNLIKMTRNDIPSESVLKFDNKTKKFEVL